MDQAAFTLIADVWDLGGSLMGGLYQVFVHDSHGIKQAYHENDLVLGTEKAVDLLLNIVSLGFAIKGLKPKNTSKIENVSFHDEISNPTAELVATSDDGYWSMWDDMPSHEFNLYDYLGFNDPSHLPMLSFESSQPSLHATMHFFRRHLRIR